MSLTPLIPVPVVAALSTWWRRSLRSAPSSLRLFYDGECRFCLFACRLVVAVAGLRDEVVVPAATDPFARRILEENGSWSVAPLGAAPGAYRHGWDAVRLALARSPRPWLVRLVPGARVGERLYGLIAKYRSALGLVGAVCFGCGRGMAGHGPAGAVFVSFALAAVVAWNVVTYPAVREWWDLRHVVRPVVATLGLTQYWTMFAPRPYPRDAWHLVPGLGRDGQVVELLSGEELRVRPPVDGPRHYGGVRWRTAVFRSIKRREVDWLLRYWCGTGRWDAVELWEFRRANLGVAATAELPYEARRLAFWECDGADLARVEAFTDEVARQMGAFRNFLSSSGRESTSVP